MKAAVLQEFNAPLKITEVELAPPRLNEVLVKTAASGVCGSDVMAAGGGSSTARNLPCVLGHEAAGTVVEVGPNVTDVAPGDHVVIAMNGPCGHCRECGRDRPQLCTAPARRSAIQGLTADGGTRLTLNGEPVRPYIGIGAFAEYTVVRDRMCVPVPHDLPLDVLALTACGVITGVGAVLNTAKVEPGSSVLVMGCGGVGLSAIQGAVIAGASEVIATDPSEDRLALAERLGATRTLHPADLGPELGSTARGGTDYAFDATGNAAALPRALAATRPGGTTVMVGIPPRGRQIALPPTALADRTLLGTQGGDALPDRDIPRLIDFYRAGRLDLDRMIGARHPLSDVNKAIENTRTGSTARSLIVFD